MTCPQSCHTPNCALTYREHLLGISIASAALPTRAKPDVARINAKEKQWDRDMPAYRELRKQGEQPRRIDGCADLAARAESSLEISYGKPLSKNAVNQAADLLAA